MQVKCLLVCRDCFFGLELLGERRTVFVPQSVVLRVFFDRLQEVLACQFKVRLYEAQDAEGQQHLGVLGFDHMGLFESCPDLIKV